MRAMAEEKRGYKSYLLRLWESNENGKRLWRASLEKPGTGERQGFASLQALFAFLEEQTGACESQAEEGG
jgi:hypothetical protein